jgi:hypothetical protein
VLNGDKIGYCDMDRKPGKKYILKIFMAAIVVLSVIFFAQLTQCAEDDEDNESAADGGIITYDYNRSIGGIVGKDAQLGFGGKAAVPKDEARTLRRSVVAQKAAEIGALNAGVDVYDVGGGRQVELAAKALTTSDEKRLEQGRTAEIQDYQREPIKNPKNIRILPGMSTREREIKKPKIKNKYDDEGNLIDGESIRNNPKQ